MSDSFALGLVVVISALVIGAAVVLGRRTGGAATSRWIFSRRRPIALAAGGALIALTGVGMWLHASFVGTEVVDLAAVEAGAEIQGGFVVVEGYARPDVTFRREGSESYYTPITSSADGARVAVLFAGAIATSGRGRWSGFVNRSNQASFRRDMESHRLRPTSDVVRILPESKQERGRVGSWVALAGLGVFGAGLIWLRRS